MADTKFAYVNDVTCKSRIKRLSSTYLGVQVITKLQAFYKMYSKNYLII